MKKFIDLKLFSESEGTENVEQTTVTDTGTTEETQQVKPDQEEIPAELQGVDEEIAREIMAQAQSQEKATNPEEESTKESSADADSDTKQVEESQVLDEAQHAIPYTRFKEVNEKAKAKDAENVQLREELARLKAQSQVPQQPAINTVATQTTVPQVQQPIEPRITPEMATKVNQIAFNEALKLSGLTKEEVDVLEYADDDDPKALAWKGSLEMARARTWGAVNTELENRRQQQTQFVQMHQQVVSDYDAFEREQMQSPDFEKAKDHAVNTYFSKLPLLDQQTVAAAWTRVERKVCSPQDVMVVKNYYQNAVADYRNSNPVVTQTTNTQTDPAKEPTLIQKQEKIKQMEKHPRVDQISGNNNVGQTTTVDGLQRMLQEKNWDDIPQDIQDLLLAGGR